MVADRIRLQEGCLCAYVDEPLLWSTTVRCIDAKKGNEASAANYFLRPSVRLSDKTDSPLSLYRSLFW